MLRRIRAISHSVPLSLVKHLVTSLVLSRLDYVISAHAGLPNSTLSRLQRVLTAAARITCGATRYDSVKPLLHHLNWLPIQGRIDYRLAILAFNCQQNRAPTYLSMELTEVASLSARKRLRSASSGLLSRPRVRCPTLGGRAFLSTSASVWNSLPSSVSSQSDFLVFKKLCKSTFIAKYFIEC